MTKDKDLERKNKILGAIFLGLAFISIMGAMIWAYMYAPLIFP